MLPVAWALPPVDVLLAQFDGASITYSSLEAFVPRAYGAVEMPLKVVQTAAVLEIVHSALGLVKSPVGTTFIQG